MRLNTDPSDEELRDMIGDGPIAFQTIENSEDN